MRVAVLGTGGTGGYFGGLLARAGHEVIFVARGPHLDAIRANGLTVNSRLAGNFTVRAAATDDIRSIGPVDLVLVCVKTYSMDAVLPALRSLVGPQTVIMSMQNGIDNEDRIAAAAGPEHVLGLAAQVSAFIQEPGVVVQAGGPGRLIFGEMAGGESARSASLAKAFQAAGIAIEARSDVKVALWEKFIFICSASGVTALTRLPAGPIFADRETTGLLRATLDEGVAVAKAEGIHVAARFTEQTLGFMAKLEPWMRGSMALDLLEGRRLELETLNGTMVRLGRAREVPVPVTWTIYAALRPFENGPPAIPAPSHDDG
ncbi:MAG TPA: 2-dehydropantoate 2-reductase [bacterium]|nr:2-dehydropantoate 2-reductase [bacterium]